MSNIEKQFKNDFEDNVKYSKKFNTSQLENNVTAKKKFNPLKVIIPVASVLTICATVIPFGFAIGLFQLPTREQQTHVITRKYQKADLLVLNQNTFKPINNPTLPLEEKEASNLYQQFSIVEQSAYSSFSDKIFKELEQNKNSMFSPITLYGVLNSLSNSASNTKTEGELNALLGLNATTRNNFYKKTCVANSYNISGFGNVEIHNGAFFTNEFDYNQTYIDALTDMFTECYQLDYTNNSDINLLMNWAKERMRYQNITKEDFGINQDGTDAFTLISTLYFNSEWSVIFDEENIQQDFNLANGDKVNTNFMKHSYFVHNSYQYDDYYSVEDSYTNLSTISYIVPKGDKTIYDIIEENNVFNNDKNNLIPSINPETYNAIGVSITMPELKFENKIDFRDIMEELDCSNMFDFNVDSFGKAFTNATFPTYLGKLFQANSINLNKKGTEIKNVTVSHMGFGASAPAEGYIDFYDIVLDKPFGYIIRDLNGIPLFAGIVDNPNA